MATYDLIIHGGTLVNADQISGGDIGVRDGQIIEIGSLDPSAAAEAINAAGLHILPGAIDSQVHFREPGNEHKEDLASGTAAAALGGITAVLEMPNTHPPTTDADRLADKVKRAAGRVSVDIGFFVGASPENSEQLGEIETGPGCCGIKLFMGSSTGNLLVADDDTIAKVLRAGRRQIAVHSEDEERLNERKGVRRAGDPTSHAEWRDVETARRSTARLIKLARAAKRRVHVLHITTAEEIDLLADAGGIVSVECTPQHLTLSAPDCYQRLGTYAQMNPPIRGSGHRAALWRGIETGTVTVIGSDHAPHTREEKDKGYPNTPSGMPGVQTLLPVMLDHVNAGRLSLQRLVELVCVNPARLYRMPGRGTIALGNQADLTVIDLKKRHTITNDWIASKCGWTPFDGVEVQGWPVATIVRGQTVMRDGALCGGPQGQVITFPSP